MVLALVALALGVSSASAQPNSPPVPSGITDGQTFTLQYDGSLTIPFSFASPEAGQTTTVSLIEVTAPDASFSVDLDASNAGNPATGTIGFYAFASTNTQYGGSAVYDVEGCDDEGACTTVRLTFVVEDPPVMECSPAAPVSIVAYDPFGMVFPGFGDYVEVYTSILTGQPASIVDLRTCTLVVFDPTTGAVTFAYTPTDVSGIFEDTYFTEADPGIPVDFLPDGPGAFALIDGDVAVGTDVLDVTDDIVVALVYGGDGDEVERVESPRTASDLADFLDALALFRNDPPVPVGIADGDVIEVTVDQTETINFSFTSPEASQTTTITFEEAIPGSFNDNFIFSSTPGNPATAEVEFSVLNGTGGAPTGDYDFVITATDDATPAASTTLTVTVQVRYPPTQSCGFGVDFYINEFRSEPAVNYFQLYSTESGLVDLTGCSFVAFDAATEAVVISEPLTATLFPYGEPNFEAGTDFTGLIPSGPGAIAIVLGAPSVGDDVTSVLGDVVNAIVYYSDGSGDYDDANIFAICGAGTLLGGAVPYVPCDSAEGSAMLTGFGGAVAAEGAPEAEMSLSVAPNPARAASVVTLTLPGAADVRVAVYDALGREVALLTEASLGVGRHEVAFEADRMPAGVYVVRAAIGADVRTAAVTVVR